jgi:molybdate transport system permease protein
MAVSGWRPARYHHRVILAVLTSGEWQALWLSLRVALLCVVLSLLPGVALGWVLARLRFPGKALLDALLHLPLVLPPVVVGYVLLVVLGRYGWLGSWLHDALGLRIAFTWWAAVLASAIVGFPLLVRSVRLGIELVDTRVEDAARTLGASRWRVFRTVTLLLAMPGVLTGAVLAFARSLGEFGATITFAGNIPGQTRTIPLAIYTAVQSPDGTGSALRLVIISIVLSLAALIISEMLTTRIARRLGGAR